MINNSHIVDNNITITNRHATKWKSPGSPKTTPSHPIEPCILRAGFRTISSFHVGLHRTVLSKQHAHYFYVKLRAGKT